MKEGRKHAVEVVGTTEVVSRIPDGGIRRLKPLLTEPWQHQSVIRREAELPLKTKEKNKG